MIKINDNLEENYDLSEQMDKFEQKTGNSFLKFYNKYLPKLIYHNNNFLHDSAVAEDIATDSILKSLKKIDDYDPEKAAYSTWLFTISKNECIQYLNKAKKLISVDKFVDDEGTTIKDFLEDKYDEDQGIRDIENLNIKKGKILEEKINLLKNPYRKVIKLREIEKRSYREITVMLREKQDLSITSDYFHKSNVLNLVDPESKKKNQLVKLHSINKIIDNNGKPVDFKIVERDKDGLISRIEVPKGNYIIKGEVPFNMSTLKSQIRNGRLNLQNMVKKEFSHLDDLYL
jgi:RNA polymerase sigma-70 factor (ECF subfamily)